MKATPTHPQPESLPSLFRSDGLNRLSKARCGHLFSRWRGRQRETPRKAVNECCCENANPPLVLVSPSSLCRVLSPRLIVAS